FAHRRAVRCPPCFAYRRLRVHRGVDGPGLGCALPAGQPGVAHSADGHQPRPARLSRRQLRVDRDAAVRPDRRGGKQHPDLLPHVRRGRGRIDHRPVLRRHGAAFCARAADVQHRRASPGQFQRAGPVVPAAPPASAQAGRLTPFPGGFDLPRAPGRWHIVRMSRAFAFALAALVPGPALAQDPEPPTPASVVAEAPAADWRAIDPADLLVMTLAPDRDGNERQVVIQLIPPPFSQGWVGNIRTLAKAHWWDGTTVYRVVDNWVAQWGDGEDDEAKATPLPAGLRVVPEGEYEIRTTAAEEGTMVL